MDFIDKELQGYVEAHSEPAPALLDKIERQTWLEELHPRMLSGHLQGRILSLLSWMIRPKRILEIGAYTGYSGISLAEGLTEDGMLYSVEINEELEDKLLGYFEEAGIAEKVQLHIGSALDIVPTLDEEFDLVFIDADKENYLNYYNMVVDKVRPNGFIIADNVLWSGKVVGAEKESTDKDTRAILEFNDFVHQDDRVQNALFPVRDGLMVLRKI